jgi:hypothetical protein
VATLSIDDLFQLPLSEFTAARNALASQLKKSGHADEAARIKTLAKPSISAWAVNQLFWRHRKLFDRLIASGEEFREAQAAQISGKAADIRKPLEERRKALAELAQAAAVVLKEASHPATPETMRRVTTTLEALSTLANVPDAPRAGRLTDDVDPPGFETLAALIPSVGGAKSGDGRGAVLRFAPKPPRTAGRKRDTGEDDHEREQSQKARAAAAKAAVQAAERNVRDAQRTAEQAEAGLKKAAARLKEAERTKAELEQQLEQATAELNEARQGARRATTAAEDAAQGVTDAERALEKARKELDAV